ncbi:hypothetical protein [Streptomyces sp. NPDC005776]|uniref:alpha/beta fold hydrolase n=1 Tax=unclassified Streptomyces TaxID=2593676 RepID=UPI0033FF3472
MALIVGVHGIAQEQLGRRQLLGTWENALLDGVEAALRGGSARTLSFDLAYYGRLFLDAMDEGGQTTKSADVLDDTERWTRESGWEDLRAEAEEAAGQEALDAVAPLEDKGYTRLPPGVALILRALDWRYGPGAAVLFIGAFRQVRRYLRDPDLKAAIDAAVDAAVAADCRVLVGHSLGSVVAFEYVRRNPARELDLILTMGSPLGARFVRSLLPEPEFGAGGLPAVATWVNIRDPRDPVAFAGDLARSGWNAQDVTVHNGGDSHAAPRYLGKRQTGAALLAALSEPAE